MTVSWTGSRTAGEEMDGSQGARRQRRGGMAAKEQGGSEEMSEIRETGGNRKGAGQEEWKLRRNKTADGKMDCVENGKKGKAGIEKWKQGKTKVTALALIFSVCIFTGCRLAREERSAQDPEEDRLVGVFVTEEYLDTGMPEVTMSPGGEVSLVENKEGIAGRIVSDENGWRTIVFHRTGHTEADRGEDESAEIKGFGIYDIRVREEGQEHYTYYGFSDDIFSDVYWAVNSSDSAESGRVEATVYVEPDGPEGFYFNPVYQTAQGDIYLQPGTGLFDSERPEGASGTHTMSWKRSVGQDGQETVEESTFAITIICAVRPTAYRLLFMGEDSQIAGIMTGEELAKMWEQGQWELKVPGKTAYLVLEQEREGIVVGRVFCDQGEKYLEFLQGADGGYLVKRQMDLIWE
ncbi:MAG: hypothetical protein NC517_13550 [Firmicutes bacterium]|nr:hypothetical protein [Bacillota bacterium]